MKKSLNHPKEDQLKRATFCQKIAEHKAKAHSLLFLDESGFHDAPRTNVIGALLEGVLLNASLFQTTINTSVFNAWVEQDLIPKLPKNSVFVMDNATFHKGEDMQKVFKTAGHTLLYLPSYSPDLNPIEKK